MLRQLLCSALLCAAAANAAWGATVTVFAASSLKEAMDAQVRAFTARTGDKVVVSYAGSNVLARQIENGAPADLFIAADTEWMDYAAQRGLVNRATRSDLLGNALVLVAPAASMVDLAIAPGFALAAALGNGRLALANPDSVPAGKYAKHALEFLGVWGSVERKVARNDNVRAALAFVARGEAPLGIVYRTDALAEPGVRIVGTFPPASHPPIVYPVALVAGERTPAAKALLDALRSPAAAAEWRRFGFTVLP